jgi:hypothetical protein
MRSAFLELVHILVLCHCKTFEKNANQLQMHGYWPTWRRDLRVYLASCRPCLEYHRGQPARQGALRPISNQVYGQGQVVSIDLTGPHPMSNGYKYCFTAQDVFSKFLFVQGLREKSAECVANAIVKVFLRAGIYNTVRTDCGAEFVNALHNELYRLTGTAHVKTLPYSPNQNPVERSPRTINSMIGKLIERNNEWSGHLDYVAAVYNATVQKATGFTPNFLHFGREMASQISVLLANSSSNCESFGEYARDVVQRINVPHQLACECLNQSAEHSKRYYDKKVKPQVFEVGDRVLVYSPRKRRNCYPKWQRQFSEEASIVSKINDITNVVRLARSKQNRVVHVDKLRLLSRVVCESAAAETT